MDTKSTNDPAMRNLERTIRFEFERVLLLMTIVCLVLEIGIAVYYYLTDNLGQPLNTYIEFRIIVPFAINSILYIVTRFTNRSDTSTDMTKNRVVSFAGLIMTGVIALAHSYFIPLWVFPVFVVVICSIFHDSFIQMIQAGLSFVFILYAGIIHIYDYPDERNFSILCIIISEVLAIGISFLSFKLESFNTKMLIIRERNFEQANNFEKGFETDSVTGVYSKKYLSIEAEKILNKTNELDPCGIAVLDIDQRSRSDCRIVCGLNILHREREAASARHLNNGRRGHIAIYVHSCRIKDSSARKSWLSVHSKSDRDRSHRSACRNRNIAIEGHSVCRKTLIISDTAQNKNPCLVLMVDIPFPARNRCSGAIAFAGNHSKIAF